LHEKSGAVALSAIELYGRQYGKLAVQQASWLADEIILNLEIFKIIYWMNFKKITVWP